MNACALERTVDGTRSRQRISSIDENHKQISSYVFHLRLGLGDVDDIKLFLNICEKAKLQKPLKMLVTPVRLDLYNAVNLETLFSGWYEQFSWSICFYLEGALRDGLLVIDDFQCESWDNISTLIPSYPDEADILIRNFIQDCRLNFWGDNLPHASRLEELGKVFTGALADDTQRANLQLQIKREGRTCRVITFTPTRMLLDGPYPAQSNRILRQWDQYSECFIRVNFRDENWLHYRQNRLVDNKSILKERVGDILKSGFDLCGKHFEFLGYASSSLRDHNVWFMTPFNDPDSGYVNAARIRSEAGDFSGELRYPARYAARLAQAFTTTDPSIRLRRSDWRMIEDLGTKPYLHTDGISLKVFYIQECLS